MKRGSFLMTTVATGLMVAGLLTVGRAGLKSQGFLFLAGQMKIAAGDTDSGMKLLAKAASGPEMNSNSMLASEKPAVISTAAAEKKPCPKMNAAPVIWKVKSDTTQIKVKFAPEPTLASLAPHEMPMPPMMIPATFQADPAAFITRQQVEAIRTQQSEMRKAQRIREMHTKKLLHEISVKYSYPGVSDPEQIREQVQKDLGTWAQ
jgi:hypothetical protein